MKVLVGLLWLIVIIGNGLAIVRRQRRSGDVQSYGHPVKDNLLLLGSAIVLSAAMLVGFWLLGPPTSDPESPGRYLFIFAFLILAAGITYVANYILQLGRKRK